jgi:hypothetical protein
MRPDLRIHTLLAIAALSLALPGCGKSSKSADVSEFKYYPADTELLVGVDGAKVRAGGQAEKLANRLPEQVRGVIRGLKSCGIDVIGTTETAVIASNVESMKGVASIKGFNRGDFTRCGEVAKEYIIKDDGTTTSVTVRGVSANLGWIDDKTFIGGAYWKPEEVAAFAAGKGGADGNKALMSLLDQVDQKAPVWFAFVPRDPEIIPSTGMGEIVAAFGTVDVSDGLKLKIGARMKDADQAKSLATGATQVIPMLTEQYKSQLGELTKFASKLQFEAKGKNTILRLDLSAAELDELARLIASNETVRNALQSLGL